MGCIQIRITPWHFRAVRIGETRCLGAVDGGGTIASVLVFFWKNTDTVVGKTFCGIKGDVNSMPENLDGMKCLHCRGLLRRFPFPSPPFKDIARGV